MAKMGRPEKEIDKEQFEKLCGLQCTQVEISGWFHISADTLDRWCKRTYKKTFADVFREKRQSGCISLRRKQMETALGGNITMLIFLGKQYLGQSDKIEQDVLVTSVSKNPALVNYIENLNKEHEERDVSNKIEIEEKKS